MARGYWIVRVDVSKPEAYKNYVAANGTAFAKFGGRFLVRGGSFEAMLGTSRARNVVVEFSDHATAVACWHSKEYQDARAKQEGGAEIDMIVIEGYDGPQPGTAEATPPSTPASE